MESKLKLREIELSVEIELTSTLISLGEFCREFETSIKNNIELLQKEDYRTEFKSLRKLISDKRLNLNIEVLDSIDDENLSKEELLLYKLVESGLYSLKVIPFYRMSVVYSFSLFEGFLKDCLTEVFLYKTEILKKRSKSIDYEILFDFQNLNDMKFYIVTKEVEKIGYMNIDEINDYLKTIFNIRLNKMKEWEDFRENYYRRNVIVHNNSRISELYAKKLNLSNEKIGKTIHSDLEYAENCIRNTLNYISFIRRQITKNLKLD